MAEKRLHPRSDSSWTDVLRAVAARKRREEDDDERELALAHQG